MKLDLFVEDMTGEKYEGEGLVVRVENDPKEPNEMNDMVLLLPDFPNNQAKIKLYPGYGFPIGTVSLDDINIIMPDWVSDAFEVDKKVLCRIDWMSDDREELALIAHDVRDERHEIKRI